VGRSQETCLAREDGECALAYGPQRGQPRRVSLANAAQKRSLGARTEDGHVEAQGFGPVARLRKALRAEFLAAVTQLGEIESHPTNQNVDAKFFGAL
jgi:hypothetical protein